jgi:aminoglycoside phosphotransferase (APT) family kinase protein
MNFVKRRDVPEPGSIPAVLDMFRAEVLFYREIAPVVGVRVPACHRAESGADGTLLELEDLSAWAAGAEPEAYARVLADLHGRWAGAAPQRWPWLRPAGAAVGMIGAFYDQTWPALAARADLPAQLRGYGERLVGRAAEADRLAASCGPVTLVHGNASTGNARTSPLGEIALVDWEDVSVAAGLTDVAWLLVSSLEPARWDDTIRAYGSAPAQVVPALPAVVVQGLLSLAYAEDDDAPGWIERLTEATERCR